METFRPVPLPHPDRMTFGENLIATAIMGSFFAGSIAFSIYPVVASDVVKNLTLSSSESGLLMSLFLLGYGLMATPAGLFSARYSSRAVLIVALTLMAAGFLLFSLGNQFPVMLLSRWLMGVGCAALIPSANHLLTELFTGAKLLRAVAIFGSGWGVGYLFAFAVLGYIFVSFGWRATMVAAAVVTLLVVLAIALPLRGKAAKASGEPADFWPPGTVHHLLANRPLALLTVVNFASMSTMVGMITWAPAYLQSAFHSDVLTSNLNTGIAGIAMVMAAYLGGVLGIKYGRRAVIVVSAAACFAIPAVAAVAASEAVVVVLIVLTGTFTLLNFSPIFSTVPRYIPASLTGTASGFVTALGLGGSLVSPYLFGLALDFTGAYAVGFTILAVIAFVGFVASLALPSDRYAYHAS